MRIILDRTALRELVDKDPTFELDLKNQVLAEVGRRFFEKDAARVISAASPELFAQALSGIQDDADLLARINRALQTAIVTRDTDWHRRLKLSSEMTALIENKVSEIKERAISDTMSKASVDISKRVGDALEKALELVNIDDRIEKRVARLTEEYIAKRAKELFDQRMADVRAVMGGA